MHAQSAIRPFSAVPPSEAAKLQAARQRGAASAAADTGKGKRSGRTAGGHRSPGGKAAWRPSSAMERGQGGGEDSLKNESLWRPSSAMERERPGSAVEVRRRAATKRPDSAPPTLVGSHLGGLDQLLLDQQLFEGEPGPGTYQPPAHQQAHGGVAQDQPVPSPSRRRPTRQEGGTPLPLPHGASVAERGLRRGQPKREQARRPLSALEMRQLRPASGGPSDRAARPLSALESRQLEMLLEASPEPPPGEQGGQSREKGRRGSGGARGGGGGAHDGASSAAAGALGGLAGADEGHAGLYASSLVASMTRPSSALARPQAKCLEATAQGKEQARLARVSVRNASMILHTATDKLPKTSKLFSALEFSHKHWRSCLTKLDVLEDDLNSLQTRTLLVSAPEKAA